ncbi:rho guanine nucleotide exchange factor 3 isoform X1 [Lampetra fluviatilis]
MRPQATKSRAACEERPHEADTPRIKDPRKPPIRRGSSFTFLTPGPYADSTLRRKRNRKQDADSVSLYSLDVKEPSTKKVRPLSRVASLANLITPVKAGTVKRIGQTLQRSISFRSENQAPTCSVRPYSKHVAPTPPKRRNSRLWSETYDAGAHEAFSRSEIKRQEAIFELAQGEQDLIEDLKLAKKAYRDPMLKLSIMTAVELAQIFGALDSLIPLHEDLLTGLQKARKPNGATERVGHILVEWLPCLNAYTCYCANQVAAKALLDQKKQDPRVQDFLQRCLESPFSRKLELWSFLDVPRSRLVKYPLLLREILRHTPNEHPDQQCLEEAISIIQGVVADVNTRTGESECCYFRDKLDYLDERQRDPLIAMSRTLHLHGELRNNRGTKLFVLLFGDVLVLSRPASRGNDGCCYQVYRQPIPLRDLRLEDLQDGEVKMGGSFRGAFSNNDKAAKNIFRVGFKDSLQGQSHTLQAHDSYSKQQWLNSIRSAITALGVAAPDDETSAQPEQPPSGADDPEGLGPVPPSPMSVSDTPPSLSGTGTEDELSPCSSDSRPVSMAEEEDDEVEEDGAPNHPFPPSGGNGGSAGSDCAVFSASDERDSGDRSPIPKEMDDSDSDTNSCGTPAMMDVSHGSRLDQLLEAAEREAATDGLAAGAAPCGDSSLCELKKETTV